MFAVSDLGDTLAAGELVVCSVFVSIFMVRCLCTLLSDALTLVLHTFIGFRNCRFCRCGSNSFFYTCIEKEYFE